MAVTYSGDAATTRTNLGLGSLATKSSVGAAEITDNSVSAAELNVSGNGTAGQALVSDGDGSFSWDTVGSSTTLGDIGTYAQVYNSKFVNGVQYNLGETASGSEFRKKNSNTAYGGNYGTGNTSFMLYGNSTSAGLTGTWRCMSNDCISTGNEANNRAMYPALWVRVS